MTSKASNDLSKLVNASGFAFQIAVEHQLRSTLKTCKITLEYPWHDETLGREGFIDLLLEQGGVTWVIECKRPKDGEWVFLVPNDRVETPDLCCLWIAGAPNAKVMAGWDVVNLLPQSYQSMFCVVHGTGEGDRSLLERLGSQLILSASCLANEQLRALKARPKEFIGVYIPVIVTTASLHVCRFDPSAVSLADGQLSNGKFEEVPFVRFRKSLAAISAISAPPPPLFLGIGMETEPTVLVINAQHLSFFKDASIKVKNEDFDTWPWRKALMQLQAMRPTSQAGIGAMPK